MWNIGLSLARKCSTKIFWSEILVNLGLKNHFSTKKLMLKLKF